MAVGHRLAPVMIAALGAFGLLAGCGDREPPAPTPLPPTVPTETKPLVIVPPTPKANLDLAKARPDVTPDPKVWYAEWRANTRAASEKYDGKVVEMSGEVQSVTALLDDHGDVVKGVIYLKGAAPTTSSAARRRTGSRGPPWRRAQR